MLEDQIRYVLFLKDSLNLPADKKGNYKKTFKTIQKWYNASRSNKMSY